MPSRRPVPLSVLDLCPVPAGESSREALRRSVDLALSSADYASQVAELRGYFAGRPAQDREAGDNPAQDRPAGQIRAIPAEGNEPAVWLLGSTGYSAEMAGLLGLPFAFAYHISAANARPALALYRQVFRPSAQLAEPYCVISVSVLCAEDAEAARWRHGSTRLSALRLRAGRPSTLPSPQEAAGRAYSDGEQAVIAEATASHVVGDPATVVEQLGRLAETTGADELMVTTSTFAHADRLASYELLAPAAGQGEQRASVAPAVVLEHVGHAGRPGQAADPAEGLR